MSAGQLREAVLSVRVIIVTECKSPMTDNIAFRVEKGHDNHLFFSVLMIIFQDLSLHSTVFAISKCLRHENLAIRLRCGSLNRLDGKQVAI